MKQPGEHSFHFEGLEPGTVIHFADIKEIPAFEDLLVPLINPEYNPFLWAARSNIRDLVRPPTFNGTIRDVTLTAMQDPYARLLDANDRGWHFQKGGVGGRNAERKQEVLDQVLDRYYGFIFDAEAHSSSPGLRGRIGAEVWYYPVAQQLNRARSIAKHYVTEDGENHIDFINNDKRHNDGNRTGETVRRLVTKPLYDKEHFAAAHETSKAIGFTVLAEAMRHAIRTPMQN